MHVLVLTEDLQFKVHAVLSSLINSLTRVLSSIFSLHSGDLQHLST